MSQLEAIANQLRELADSTGHLSTNVEAAAGRLRGIASRVATIKRAGVDTRSLEGAILNAEAHSERAADAVREIMAEGTNWADQLARGSAGAARSRASGPAGVPATLAGASASSTLFQSLGLREIALNDADYSDNPILGEFGRGDTTRDDYIWATDTWKNVVKPAIDDGADRSFFEQRDKELDAPPLRRSADVYDMYLGGDPIRVSTRPDGSLEVNGGRHRIETARQLGLTHLPAKVF